MEMFQVFFTGPERWPINLNETTECQCGNCRGVGGFNPPQVNVFNPLPLVVLLCLSWGGVRNNPHR